MRMQLKGIHTVKAKLANGRKRTYYYAWRGGPRISGEPGTPEFLASYSAALASRRQPDARRMRAIIAVYKASDEFRTLAERTKKDYLKHIGRIEVQFGDMPISGLSDPRARGVFKAWRDRLATKSRRQADYAWTILARMFSVAKDRGLVSTNPCEKGGRIYKAERQDKIWSEADEAKFLAKAPMHLHLPLLLALWTGQRQGDLLRLIWGSYDGRYIRLKQSKGGRRVKIPVGAPLKAMLDLNRPASDAEQDSAILLTKDGQPWTEDGFRSSWRKACQKAGIDDLTFHDFRGSAVTRLALAGATVPEIAALTGHSLKDVEAILDAHYLGRDVGLAESGIAKLERAADPKREQNL